MSINVLFLPTWNWRTEGDKKKLILTLRHYKKQTKKNPNSYHVVPPGVHIGPEGLTECKKMMAENWKKLNNEKSLDENSLIKSRQ